MATIYNIYFGTSKWGGIFLRLGPLIDPAVGLYYFGEFRVGEYTGGYRVSGVQVPFADGLKDVGDGKRAAGTETIEGHVFDTEIKTAENNALAIVGKFDGKTDFWVWRQYGPLPGTTGTPQKCKKLQSYRLNESAGWGGVRWDVSLTFAVYDPEV